jgi:uncharacterized membrane protein
MADMVLSCLLALPVVIGYHRRTMIEHISGFEQIQLTWVHFVDFLVVTLATLQIPLPVGMLGLWRWGVWLFRRFIGLFYYPQEASGYMTSTTVITPVYNEVPQVFQAALRSWAANQPTEIIAVITRTKSRLRFFMSLKRNVSHWGLLPG